VAAVGGGEHRLRSDLIARFPRRMTAVEAPEDRDLTFLATGIEDSGAPRRARGLLAGVRLELATHGRAVGETHAAQPQPERMPPRSLAC
jgi:hypothetical protein